jgi:hypothetical protein
VERISKIDNYNKAFDFLTAFYDDEMDAEDKLVLPGTSGTGIGPAVDDGDDDPKDPIDLAAGLPGELCRHLTDIADSSSERGGSRARRLSETDCHRSLRCGQVHEE